MGHSARHCAKGMQAFLLNDLPLCFLELVKRFFQFFGAVFHCSLQQFVLFPFQLSSLLLEAKKKPCHAPDQDKKEDDKDGGIKGRAEFDFEKSPPLSFQTEESE